MVLCEGKYLANIDFGWLEESPKIDTNDFPIPKYLRIMLKTSKSWPEFCDLCWDALHVLHLNKDEVVACWRRHLRKVEPPLTDPLYHDQLMSNMVERMQNMPRLKLDQELDRTYLFSKTHAKDSAHDFGKYLNSSKPEPEPSTDTPSPALRPMSTQPSVDRRVARATSFGSWEADSSVVDQSDIRMLKEEVTELKEDLREVKSDLAEMKGMMHEILLRMTTPSVGGQAE